MIGTNKDDDAATKPRSTTLCAGCRHLEERPRTDFWPAGAEYVCGRNGRWIGFIGVTPEWCEGREENA
jgi:hypothetical protein